MRRILAGLALLLLGAVLLAGGAWLLAQRALADGSLSPRIDAALERALGRAVTLGPVTVRPGLWPRITVAGAEIANLPGGSRPDFARIGRLEVTLGLRPLLSGRIELRDLSLDGADLLLERDAAGRPNWVFGMGEAEGGEGARLALDALHIRDARVALPGAWPYRIGITEATLRRVADDGTALSGTITLDGRPVAVEATLGAWTGESPPAMQAELTGSGLRLGATGTVPRRLEEAGWGLALTAQAESPAALAAWLAPGTTLPPLGRIGAAARLGPGPGGIGLREIRLEARAVPRDWPLPGLAVTVLGLRAADLDAPATLTGEGRRGAATLSVQATLPAPRSLFEAGARTALPIDATIASGAARLTLRGQPTPAALRDGTATVEARLETPRLSALEPLASVSLPPLRDVAVMARAGWMPPATLRLDGLRAEADAATGVTGRLEIRTGPRLALSGQLAAQRLDLDALLPARPPQATSGGTARLIPDLALPVQTLRAFDASLGLSLQRMQAAGLGWSRVETRVALAAGRLALQPFAATIPGGRIAGSLTLDAAAAPPALALSLRSEGNGIDLPTLGRAFGTGGAVLAGPAEIALDLAGRGATLRRIAATLGGEAGLAMVEGRLAWAHMLRVGPNLARALLAGRAPGQDGMIRCVALRLSAEAGLAQSQALLLEGNFGRIDGSLALNLRDETLAARLLPEISVFGGVTLRAPVTIGGSFAHPRVGVEPGAALAQVIGDTVANRLWRSSTVAWLRGAEGGPPPAGSCEADLRLARLGGAGRAPAPAPAMVPLVPRELQGTVGGVVGGVARGAETVVGGVAQGAQDVLRGVGGVLGGAGGLLTGGRR